MQIEFNPDVTHVKNYPKQGLPFHLQPGSCQYNYLCCSELNGLEKSMDLNRAKGVLYGLAIGDALGRITEFKSLAQIKSEYGDSGITDLPEPALFTDDNYNKRSVEDYFGNGKNTRDDKSIKSIVVASRGFVGVFNI